MENFHEQPEKNEDTVNKKTGWLKRNIALAGAIGMGYFSTPDVEAQSTNKVDAAKEGQKTAQVESTKKVTENSLWATELVSAAKADLEKLKTKEDATWFLKDHFNKFVGEFYMPTKGKIVEGPYKIKTRDSNPEDNRNILENAKLMIEILEEVNAKFPVPGYTPMKEQFQDIVLKAERSVSYAGEKQEKILKEAIEKYGK